MCLCIHAHSTHDIFVDIDECDLETLSALLQDSDNDTNNSNYTAASNISMGQDVASSRLVTECARTEGKSAELIVLA